MGWVSITWTGFLRLPKRLRGIPRHVRSSAPRGRKPPTLRSCGAFQCSFPSSELNRAHSPYHLSRRKSSSTAPSRHPQFEASSRDTPMRTLGGRNPEIASTGERNLRKSPRTGCAGEAQRVMIATLRTWIGFRLNPHGKYRMVGAGVDSSASCSFGRYG
jgi:hypothetical protein